MGGLREESDRVGVGGMIGWGRKMEKMEKKERQREVGNGCGFLWGMEWGIRT